MKYLLFWEQKEMPIEERQKFSRRAREERKNEERYGVDILPPHYYETGKGVTVHSFPSSSLGTHLAAKLQLGESPVAPGAGFRQSRSFA